MQNKDIKQVTEKGSGTVASLELIRGLASLDVFLWHVLNSEIWQIHIRGLYWVMDFSRESVIVFFVLSGYVIALSQQKLHRDAAHFLKARVKRIMPIYLVALAVAFAVGWMIQAPLTLWQVVGHLLFLQSYEGTLVPTLTTNGPLWSLGTEFEFYLLFSLILFTKKPAWLLVWWCVSIAGMLLRHAGYFSSGVEGLLIEFLSLSPCWLLGYFVAGLGRTRCLSLLQSLTLFAMIPLVSWSSFGSVITPKLGYDGIKCYFLALLIAPLIHTLAVRQLFPGTQPFRHGNLLVLVVYTVLLVYAFTHSTFFFSTVAALGAIPILVFVLGYLFLPDHAFWPMNTATFRKVAVFMGGSSYALYVIHTPLIFLITYCRFNPLLQFLALLFLIACSVLTLEFVFQPWAASWVERLWKIPQRAKNKPN